MLKKTAKNCYMLSSNIVVQMFLQLVMWSEFLGQKLVHLNKSDKNILHLKCKT